MKRAFLVLGAVGAAFAAIACSSKSTHPGEMPGTGGDAAPRDAAADAAPTDDGSPQDAAGDSDAADAGPDATFAQCNQTLGWPMVARVPSIASMGFDTFGGVAWSGRTVAWSTMAGAVFVADRASPTAAFDAPVALDPGPMVIGKGKVALSDSGLKLIAPSADGRTFVSFVRASLGAPWGASLGNEFANFSSTTVELGGSISEPVVSADSLSLFYLLVLQSGTSPVLYESQWNAPMRAWDPGTPLPNPEFAITDATHRRRPTGASGDRRTLFYFDEVTGKERAAWRSAPTAPFDTFVDLPQTPEAAPDENCQALYFRGTDTSGPGLFTATRP
jgi:hypothetical protein